jgi:hypothetical protein
MAAPDRFGEARTRELGPGDGNATVARELDA